MTVDRAVTVAAWRRHIPTVTEAEVAALLPLIADRDGMLSLAVDAYRLGRASATADAHDGEILDAALADPPAAEAPTPMAVTLRFDRLDRAFVTLELDREVFVSQTGRVAGEADEVRADIEQQLRRGVRIR